MARTIRKLIIVLVIPYLCPFIMNAICIATDTISMNQQVVDDETVFSAGGIFVLGFFSPNGSQGQYVGIPVEKVAWVALDHMEFLIMINASDGNLVLVDDKNMPVSSTKINLVSNNNIINELNESVLLCESFNHPSDALLPRMMKIGLNTRTAEQIVVTSWKDEKNPSLGSFSTAVVDPGELLQVLILYGSSKHFRSGHMTKDFHNGFQLFMDNNGEELYFSYAILNLCSNIDNKWLKVQVVPKGQCDLYSTCGPFGSCENNDSPICKCLKGYEPNPNSNDERKRGDEFLSVSGMKLLDFSHYLLTWDKMECENSCLKNCPCLAYAYVDGIGCMIWGKNLLTSKSTPVVDSNYTFALHIPNLRRMLTGAHIAIIVSATFSLILIVCTIYVIGSLVPFCIASKHSSATNLLHNSFTQGNSSELPVFSFKCIETATKNFCYRNKLGEGRFGPVYKSCVIHIYGILADGQEVAIKRLWRSSRQGIEEFKNEVTLISGLQHRNLVKLMGFCIHGEEKLLIYEYMSNRSLDIFILGSRFNDKAALSWNQRYSIIEGIARGLLNLHHDSQLKIIHKDLTTSNILLDEDVNPKISDFGMARIYGGNQTIANTNKIAGTYGYMSPEYAIQGIIFEKSNVFSFGIILLEIISSKILEFPDPNVFVSLETPTQVVICIIVISTIVSMVCSDTVLPSPKRPTHSSRGSDDPNISPCSRNSISISNVQGRQLQLIC
ncbi:hypothetical protein R3W88_024540 [Solanum pinnatisectum]|uniref:Receptor-like serine/threonine-protein kinase n=1 Tax=Solanum pinnatisectum TaxID=50273 RepID=A0AAV9M2C8_9SOLN|nr:hypothetical protein R3W88_024540 [Solanum pinnatisectum]